MPGNDAKIGHNRERIREDRRTEPLEHRSLGFLAAGIVYDPGLIDIAFTALYCLLQPGTGQKKAEYVFKGGVNRHG